MMLVEPTTRRQQGYTIVELAITVPFLILTILVLFESLFLLVRSGNINRTATLMAYDTQNAISILESDAILTSTFLPTTDANITDPYKPTTDYGQWSYTGGSLTSNTRVLILRAFNTTGHPLSQNRKPSFLTDFGCDPSTIYTNQALQYNIIYFVKDGTLYRRRALDTSASTCEPPYQKQSCPSLETLGTSSRDSACQADDEIIAQNVSALSVQYYPAKNSSTPIDAYNSLVEPDIVTTAAAVDVSLTITRQTYGQEVSNTSSVRISRLNAPTGGQ